MAKGEQDDPVQKTSFARSVKLVAWSMLGIRSRKGYQDDLARVNPVHVVLVGFVAVLLLVVSLIALVNWVVAK
jgi:hypothetical protein